MDVALDLSTFRVHGESAADYKVGLAFVSPAAKWHYAISFSCSDIELPALVEIDAEILCGAAGFGLNDLSFSRYLTTELIVRPGAGRHKVRMLLDGPERDITLVIRNVSDAGERTAGVVHGVRLLSPSNYSILQGENTDVSLFERFHDLKAKAEPGFVVDFLGTKTRASTLWQSAQSLSGTKLPPPVQGDYHGDALEWIGLLKSVSSARDQWVAIELGAGHGPWSIAGGKAAILQGTSTVRLYAVEADPARFRLLRQHFVDNGFAPNEHALIEGAVGVKAGTSRWRIADSSEDWGGRPLGGAGLPEYRGLSIERSIEIRVSAISELLRREPCWDLVHLDVQGDEVDLCKSCTRELCDRVRWIIVGTHSRKIDGDMIDLLWRQDWVLEHEMPSAFKFQRFAPTLEGMTSADGTQVWRNPRFD